MQAGASSIRLTDTVLRHSHMASRINLFRPRQARNSSSNAQAGPKKPISPHVGFYKSFGRPIAKGFLGAVFTYQLAYWLWVKLETDEVKKKKRKQILELESEVRRLSS